jgi:hypothetical protein
MTLCGWTLRDWIIFSSVSISACMKDWLIGCLSVSLWVCSRKYRRRYTVCAALLNHAINGIYEGFYQVVLDFIMVV